MLHDYPTNPSIGSTLDEIAAQFGIELKGAKLGREFRGRKELTVIRGQSAGHRGRDQIRQQLGIDPQGVPGSSVIKGGPPWAWAVRIGNPESIIAPTKHLYWSREGA